MNASTHPRPPAVAGLFYPGATEDLTASVDALLAAATPGPRSPIKALIVPHAGYGYSGSTAATAYASLHAQAQSIRRVVLLGPTHRVPVRGLAVPGCQAFATPLGEIPLDTETLGRLRLLPQVSTNDAAHALEHALEVQLPFLQRRLGHFELIPIAVGEASPEIVANVLEACWGGPETLIVVSSDLSHYLPYPVAQQIDDDTCRHILALDEHLSPQQACGARPLNGLLLAAQRHGLNPELLALCNSGDTAGDRQRVVGYAAFAFIEESRHA